MPRRNATRVLLALLTLAACLYLGVQWQQSTDHQQTISIEPKHDTQKHNELSAVDSGGSRQVAAQESTTPISATENGVRSTAASAQSAAKLRVSGRIIVLDDSQLAHDKENGEITLRVYRGVLISNEVVKVTAGLWELDAFVDDRILCLSAVLSGRAAVPLAKAEPIRCTSSSEVTFTVKWPSPIVLHVRDAATGVELRSVDVLPTISWDDAGIVVPQNGTGEGMLHGSSPMTIRIDDMQHRKTSSLLFVRASGYAWTQVKCDPMVGGDVFAELVPACTLDVEILGESVITGIRIRMTMNDAPNPILDWDLNTRRTLRIESLPPGEFMISAQVGSWYENPKTLASEPVTLMPAGRTSVKLMLSSSGRGPTASISGVLVVPSAWESTLDRLSAGKINEVAGTASAPQVVPLKAVSRTNGFDTYQWQMRGMPAGKYECSLIDPSFSFTVDLPPGVASECRIEIPPPTDVTVRVVDSITGHDVPVVEVNAVAQGLDGRLTWNGPITPSSTIPGTFQSRCPIGDVEFSASAIDGGYETAVRRTMVHPGPNDVVLSLSKASGLTVILRDGNRTLPVDPDWEFRVEPISGSGRVVTLSWTETGTRIQVSNPGSYRVKLGKPIAGYFVPDEQIVVVRSGSMTDVVMDLIRKP